MSQRSRRAEKLSYTDGEVKRGQKAVRGRARRRPSSVDYYYDDDERHRRTSSRCRQNCEAAGGSASSAEDLRGRRRRRSSHHRFRRSPSLYDEPRRQKRGQNRERIANRSHETDGEHELYGSRKKRQRRRRRSSSTVSNRQPPVEVSIDGEDVRKGILKASEARSDSSNHDDSIGHFRGGAGTVIASRYQLLRDVGLGTFGRVVECRDMRVRGRSRAEFVAVKVVRSIKRYHQSALVEARIIRDINRRGGRGLSHCSILLDDFTFDDHFCMVFEILGPSLYDFMKKHQYQPFPMPCVHDFAIQLLEALEFLHSFRLIHTDMKLENILTTTVREVRYADYVIPASTRIKLIDFGGASYDWEKKSLVISTRQYRAPEVILETGWSMPADVWSVGCILAELYQGELLFCTHDDVEHLALMERVISPFPKWMLQKACEKGLSFVKEAFNADHRHHMGSVLPSKSAHFVRKARPLAGLVAPRELWFLDLLHRLLIIDPNQRSTAHEALRFLSRHEGAIVRTT